MGSRLDTWDKSHATPHPLTPLSGNHPSTNCHLKDLAVYIVKEVGTMLGPFLVPPFQPWCQINPLLTRPKKNVENRMVIMDLSWHHPPRVRVKGARGTLKDIYLDQYKNNAPSFDTGYGVPISQAGKVQFLYCCDIA